MLMLKVIAFDIIVVSSLGEGQIGTAASDPTPHNRSCLSLTENHSLLNFIAGNALVIVILQSHVHDSVDFFECVVDGWDLSDGGEDV